MITVLHSVLENDPFLRVPLLASMHTFTITDPHDRENPVVESTTDSLIYHGTHSTFSPLIEKQGFCFDGFKAAYAVEIQSIVAACDELDFKPDGYAPAKGFSDKNCVYFSASFLSARGYALNVGGERLDGALRAADAFLAFARDKQRVELQAAHWVAILKQHGRGHAATERVLFNLQSTDLVRKLAEQVQNAHSVLNLAIREGYPVVYAVRDERRWKQRWVSGADAVATGDGDDEPFGGIPLTAVSSDRIVARIEYPNGISPASE